MLTRRATLAGLTLAPWTTLPARAEPSNYQAAMSALQISGRYFPLLQLVRANADPAAQAMGDQLCAFWGDEAGAFRRSLSRPADTALPSLEGAVCEPALRTISRAATTRKMVVLNEAHVASHHRNFLAQVIRRLQPQGFTHLAAEAFFRSVSKLSDSAPLQPNLGHYTADPQFAEAIREARRRGMGLIPYEADSSSVRDASQAERQEFRERMQAENLVRFLRAHPNARVLVFCGHDHVGERPMPGWIPMAYRVKQTLGIDLLTITQSDVGSLGPHGRDDPLTRAVLRRFAPTEPIVVRTPDGLVLGTERQGADLAIFHPQRAYSDDRPGWLAADSARRRRRIRIVPRKAEALAQAIHLSDPDPAIPADQYLVPSGASRLVFFLRPGRYRLRLETAQGFEPLGEIRV